MLSRRPPLEQGENPDYNTPKCWEESSENHPRESRMIAETTGSETPLSSRRDAAPRRFDSRIPRAVIPIRPPAAHGRRAPPTLLTPPRTADAARAAAANTNAARRAALLESLCLYNKWNYQQL